MNRGIYRSIVVYYMPRLAYAIRYLTALAHYQEQAKPGTLAPYMTKTSDLLSQPPQESLANSQREGCGLL